MADELFYSSADLITSAREGVESSQARVCQTVCSNGFFGSGVFMLKLKVQNLSLCLLPVYAPTQCCRCMPLPSVAGVCPYPVSECQSFVDDVN